MGRMYSASFTEIGVTVVQDLFQIEAVTVPVIIHAIYLSQTSDLGDAASEGLIIRIRRVTDALTNVTAEAQLDTGDAAALADINANDTTPLTTGAATVHAEAWNILTPFVYLPPPELRIVIDVGNCITVNLNTAPADSITMSGTMYFEEIGS